MRVIAGELRGRRLRTVEGASVRPTSDRVREALFSILGEEVRGARFLDLYAGSGSVGIEALSRGASSAVFVERDLEVVKVLRSNLAGCGLGNQARIRPGAVLEILGRGELSGEPFEFVYVDPPYDSGEAIRVLGLLGGDPPRVTGEFEVVLEHRGRLDPPPSTGRLEFRRTARYGDTALSFYGASLY